MELNEYHKRESDIKIKAAFVGKDEPLERGMSLNEYQEKAMQTCLFSSANFAYMSFNLVGEVGEFCSKIAKAIRKSQIKIDENHIVAKNEETSQIWDRELFPEIRKELGDILWQLSGLCDIMGVTFEDVALENLKKLADRQKRGVINGDGDNR